MSRMMKAAAACAVLLLAACESTTFISTWKNPEAAPLGKAKGRTIIACVMAQDEFLRHGAEDELVAAINKRGNKGIQSYTILPPNVTDENLAKMAFAKAQAQGVVVIRPVSADKEVTTTVYTGGYYGGYWGGYYGYGWGHPYGATAVSVDTVVTIEILLYSLEQNKLVWAGRSKTTNPSDVKKLVNELVTASVYRMEQDKVF
jgi:hypothetical protein